MRPITSLVKPLALAALLATTASAHAAITFYETQAAFNTATANQGVDGYDDITVSDTTASPISRNAGVYSYTAAVSRSDSTFYGVGSAANPWLSTLNQNDTITFNTFSGGVQAAGGNFFATNDVGSGEFVLGDILLTVTDSFGATKPKLIPNPALNSFVGFVSTGLITSFTVTAGRPISNGESTPPAWWPTVDNLTLAQSAVTPVPEPETYALMMAGLGLLAAVARQRRAQAG